MMQEQIRLCDDRGMISDEPVEPGSHGTIFDPTLTYRKLLNNLRAATLLPPFTGRPISCTGSAHLAHMGIRCTNPIHLRVEPRQNPWSRVWVDGGLTIDSQGVSGDWPGYARNGESANPDCAPSGAESGPLPTATAASGTSVVQPEDGGE